MNNLVKVLGGLLIASATSLSVGGVLLYSFGLVPMSLIELTVAAIAVISFLSFFVLKGNRLAINVSTALGMLAPLFSLSVPAHIDVLFSFGATPLLSILGAVQFIGFDLFPIVFVILRMAYWKKLPPSAMKSATDKSHLPQP